MIHPLKTKVLELINTPLKLPLDGEQRNEASKLVAEYELSDLKDYEKVRRIFQKKYSIDLSAYIEPLEISAHPERYTVEGKIGEKSYAILTDPALLDNLIKETNKKVVKEVDTRKAIIAFKCGELVENARPTSYNLLMSEETGIGKDWVVKKTLELFPEERRSHKAKISPQLLAYWHNGITEPDWTWNLKSLYLEEISYDTLNSDTMTAFLSSRNCEGVVLINQKPVELKINGKPTIFITTASKNPKKDQLRRLPTCQLDDSVNQTKEISMRQCTAAETGETLDYDFEITNALRNLKRVKVKIPFARKFGEALIKKVKVHRILRTNMSRYLDIIKTMTALHQYQRESEGEYLLATYEDYELALPVFNKITHSQTTIPLTREKKKLIAVIEKLEKDDENNVWHTVSEIEAKVTFLNKQTIYNRLRELAEEGFLVQDKVERIDSRERTFKPMAYRTSNIGKLKFPSVEEVKNMDIVESKESVETIETVESISSTTVSTDSTDSNSSLEGLD